MGQVQLPVQVLVEHTALKFMDINGKKYCFKPSRAGNSWFFAYQSKVFWVMIRVMCAFSRCASLVCFSRWKAWLELRELGLVTCLAAPSPDQSWPWFLVDMVIHRGIHSNPIADGGWRMDHLKEWYKHNTGQGFHPDLISPHWQPKHHASNNQASWTNTTCDQPSLTNKLNLYLPIYSPTNSPTK